MSIYFKKYEDFLNENEDSKYKKELEKISKLEKKAEEAKKEGKYRKEKRILKRVDKIKNNIPEQYLKKSSDKEEKKKDPKDSQQEKEETKEETKKGDSGDSKDSKEDKKEEKSFKKMTPEELNGRLNDWNKKYSQHFKFKDDKPDGVSTNLTSLMNSISEDRKKMVSKAIHELVKFFKNENFEGKDVQISGFTSTTGSESYNKDLSERRAQSVLNAIKDTMKEENIDTNINFVTVGYGEDPNHLIIKNDNTTREDVKLGKGASLPEKIKEDVKDSKEKRQEINRRVEVNIENLPPTRDVEVETTTSDEKEVEVEKPESPEAEKIQFNYDSYILIKESENLLEDLANRIKNFNENNEEKIENIYISAHTKKVKDDNKKQEKIQDELLSILSTNRAYTVKRYLQAKMGSNIANNINFYLYPVAFNIEKEKKVEIHFDLSKHMQKSKEIFDDMASKYDIEKGEKGYIGKTYTKNEALRGAILYNLKEISGAGFIDKVIPLELWHEEGRFGLGQEEDFEKFKNKMTKIVEKSNYNVKIEDYVYTSK